MPLDAAAAETGRVLTLTAASGVLVAAGNGTIWLTEVEVEDGGCITDVLQVGARLA